MLTRLITSTNHCEMSRLRIGPATFGNNVKAIFFRKNNISSSLKTETLFYGSWFPALKLIDNRIMEIITELFKYSFTLPCLSQML
jgi:hypothetical protein